MEVKSLINCLKIVNNVFMAIYIIICNKYHSKVSTPVRNPDGKDLSLIFKDSTFK